MINPVRHLFSGLRDDSGNVGITFALCFIPAVLVAGGAIDYSRTVTQWSNLQQAADATALTVAHAYLTKTSTGAGLTTFAQTYLNGLMKGAQLVGDPVLKKNNTVVCVNLSYTVPTTFMRMANVNSLGVASSACSQVGQTYEVALALDNSGSMNDSAGGTSKIQSLRTAAKKLVNILIPAGQTVPQVAISIVPFNSLVNVGASQVSQSILDTAGSSSIHWQNFHRPNNGPYKPTAKFDLFKDLRNTSWGGCVEETPPPYTTTDQTFSTSTPDSTFVPYFAPDEPGGNDNSSGYACYPVPKNAGDCKVPPPSGSTFKIFANSYLADVANTNDIGSNNTLGFCDPKSQPSYKSADDASTFAEDNQTNTYPSSGATMVCKYKGTTPYAVSGILGSEVNATSGPNFLCNSQAVTPLTTDQAYLTRANTGPIDSMVAQGSTNIATGFMWAWRSLSPIVNAFPTSSKAAIGPQNPKSYTQSSPDNQKVIILMTDGQNTWLPNPYSPWGSLYESFGYTKNQRIASYIHSDATVPGSTDCGGSSLTSGNANCAMDNVFLEACKNAKDKQKGNMIVFTIGVSAKQGDVDENVLKSCATPPSSSHYFPVSNDSDMTAAFQTIAASILSLRLTQ